MQASEVKAPFAAMRRKLAEGEAVDVSPFEREGNDYIVPEALFDEDIDYCNAKTQQWIWSIGRRRSDGAILASHSAKFYLNKDFECLWLR